MILVTGGAGFIGSNIVKALAAGASELAICDLFGTTEKWRNIENFSGFDLIAPGDLIRFLNSKKNEIQAIIHMGATTDTTEKDVDLLLQNNFSFSLKLWDWSTKNETTFIYASSAAVYGNGEQGFNDDNSLETLQHLKPLNAYAWSKLLFDQHVIKQVASQLPVPKSWAGLRFFNVYGPYEHHKASQSSAVLQIYKRLEQGLPAKLFRSHHKNYPDGQQKRDFIHVDDCIATVKFFLENTGVNGIYNIGTGQARSFIDLAGGVAKSMGRPLEVEWVDTPEGIRNQYQYFTEAQVTRLREAGYLASFISLEEGIQRYVQGYLDSRSSFR